MITEKYGIERAKIMDFGIARLVDDEMMTQITAVGSSGPGTPAYVSPEQAKGIAVDYKTDIYSYGIVLYEMLAGKVPFTATTPTAVLRMHIEEPPIDLWEVRPDVPRELHRIVMQTLENLRRHFAGEALLSPVPG